mmetsp:Transcript_137934/g.384690  ORF Transcript_137934/g.384690 Transcript_137934/m.384690 type:complete len:200 (-) Transcript_137934:324-923(-)
MRCKNGSLQLVPEPGGLPVPDARPGERGQDDLPVQAQDRGRRVEQERHHQDHGPLEVGARGRLQGPRLPLRGDAERQHWALWDLGRPGERGYDEPVADVLPLLANDGGAVCSGCLQRPAGEAGQDSARAGADPHPAQRGRAPHRRVRPRAELGHAGGRRRKEAGGQRVRGCSGRNAGGTGDRAGEPAQAQVPEGVHQLR